MADPSIPILYEDNHLLVVEKPVNMPSQQDQSADPDLLSLLKADIKIRYNKPGNVFLGLVHRLDRPTGGVMVFAKTSKAASRLSDAIRRNEWQKTYMAVVHGTPLASSGKLAHYLRKDATNNLVSVASAADPAAKQALLTYQVLSGKGALALVQVILITGRSHQIRVQFAEIGCPLYGDQKYGSTWNQPGQQLALWAAELRFPHPTTKEMIVCHSMPPHSYPWSEWSEHTYWSSR